MQRYLITGGAGFIGSQLAASLLASDATVVSIDNFDPYYDITQKRANLRTLTYSDRFSFIQADINDLTSLLHQLAHLERFDAIIHLAAKAGVRASTDHAYAYYRTNVLGTVQVLELARHLRIPKVIYISSSSVYGANPHLPWREDDTRLQPISPYGASKLAGETAARVYAELYGFQAVVLRLFTVYGPGQRPDLAIHRFVRNLSNSEPIPFYGDGSSRRSYTYVGDVVYGIRQALAYRGANFDIFNIGNNQTISLADMLAILEEEYGQPALVQPLPMPSTDVPATAADLTKSRQLLHYAPRTSFREGIQAFLAWYRQRALVPAPVVSST